MTLTPSIRKTLLVLAVLFALGVPALQAFTGFGLDQRQFADAGDETLRAAGWAFSIWGVIYAGLIAHAALQLFGRNREPLFRALSPSILAIAGCGAWIIASALDARWASIAIILMCAGSALWALLRVRGQANSGIEHALGVWPIALLAGWLLPASALNILTVLTAEGLIVEAARTPMAIGGIAAVTVAAVLVLRSRASAVYAIPVAWGLIGVFAAERADQPGAAWVAIAGAVLVAGFGLGIGWLKDWRGVHASSHLKVKS